MTPTALGATRLIAEVARREQNIHFTKFQVLQLYQKREAVDKRQLIEPVNDDVEAIETLKLIYQHAVHFAIAKLIA